MLESILGTLQSIDPERAKRWNELVASVNPQQQLWPVLDWQYRTHAPFLLDSLGIHDIAKLLRDAPAVKDIVTLNYVQRSLHLAVSPLTRHVDLIGTPQGRAAFGLVLLYSFRSDVSTEQEAIDLSSVCLNGLFSYIRDGADATLLLDTIESLLKRMVSD